ncbi:MAG: HIT family protein [Acidimicrobiales bacterium]
MAEADLRLILASAAEKLRLCSIARRAASAAIFQIPERRPCPYCENLAGRYAAHGPPAVVMEDEYVVAFLAPTPLGGMEGHTLVTTCRHVESIFDLSTEEEAALGSALADTARALRSALNPPGVLIQQNNGIAAFQTVPHVHFHVIPKVSGPFPPSRPAELLPNALRQQQAAMIRSHWPESRTRLQIT